MRALKKITLAMVVTLAVPGLLLSLLYLSKQEGMRKEAEENSKLVGEDFAIYITEKILQYGAYGIKEGGLHPHEFLGMTRGVVAGLIEGLGERGGDPYIRIGLQKAPQEEGHISTIEWENGAIRSVFWFHNEWLLVSHALNCQDKKRTVFRGQGWQVGQRMFLRFDRRSGEEEETNKLPNSRTCKWDFS